MLHPTNKPMISHGASLTVVEGKPRHRFSMVIPEELLGVETHLEHFYVIKRKLISIYEYFPLMKVGPQLVEERYLHRPISAYDVSCGLFCVVFDMSIEVRNCHLWENIIWTHQVDQGGFSVKLCGNRLIIGSSQGGKYYCKIVDLFVSSHNIMTVMMGECAQNVPPILFTHEGLLMQFYMWKRTNKVIELGLLYDTGQHEKNAFEIMQINMNNNIIHNMFSHKVKITNGQIKYLLGVVVEVVSSGQEYCIELLLYELYHPQNQANGFEKLLEQVKFVQRWEDRPNDAEEIGVAKVSLELQSFEFGSYESLEGKLWVSSSTKMCCVKLRTESNPEHELIEHIIYEPKRKQQKAIAIFQNSLVITRVCNELSLCCDLLDKGKQEQGETQDIKEQIEQYQLDDEQLDRVQYSQINHLLESAKKGEKQQEFGLLTKELRKPLILKEEFPEFCMSVSMKDEPSNKAPFNLVSVRLIEYAIQTEAMDRDYLRAALGQADSQEIASKLCFERLAENFGSRKSDQDFQTQTMINEQKLVQTQTEHNLLEAQTRDLQQLQTAIAKYSSLITAAVGRSCTKIRDMSRKTKQDITKQIGRIVSTLVSQALLPYLRNNFTTLIEKQLLELKQHLKATVVSQINVFNDYIRRNDAKESTVGAHRYLQYTEQLKKFKQTCIQVMEVCQGRSMQKIAFEQILHAEIQCIHSKLQGMDAGLQQQLTKHQHLQQEIMAQVQQIKQIAKQISAIGLQSSQSESESEESDGSEASSAEDDMSGDDEEQGQTQDSHIAYSHAHYSMVNAMNPSIMPHMQQPFYGYRSDLAASQLPLPMNMTRYPIVGGLDGSMGNYLPGSPQFVQPHSYQFPTSYYQPMYEQSQMRSYPIQSRSKLTKAEKINKPNKAKQSDKAYEKKDSRDSRTRKAHD